jgi:ABC-type branched-subunit amino acid transport system ATPase component
MDSTGMLEVRNIRVEFGPVVALDGVSMVVEKGQAIGLIGANGAGKSVLFDVMTGFTTPSAGSVLFNDVEITRRSVPARARMGIRRTFQNAELFDDLSVLENLSVGAADHLDVRAFAAEVGLEPWGRELAQNLPAGVRRRVDIARALAGRPQVLLLDEPGAGLGGAEVAELARWLQDIARSGVAILVVDHDMELISSVCGTVSVLDFGQVIAAGSVADVLQDGAVRRAYLGG